MRNDIQEDDWSDMNSLEAAIPASSSSSAYFNPLKALVTSMGIDTASNTDKTMGMEITENSTFSYFSESTFGSGLIKPARYTKLRTKGGTDEGNNRTYGDGEDDENEDNEMSFSVAQAASSETKDVVVAVAEPVATQIDPVEEVDE